MERKDSLRGILDRHREQFGASMTLDEVFDLYDAAEGEAELSQEEHDRLVDRVSADPEAAARLLKLMRFPDATDPGAAEELGGVEERWSAFRQRLVEEGDVAQSSEGSPDTASRHSSPRWLLAASILLVTALTLVISTQAPWSLQSSSDSKAEMKINLPVVELLDDGSQGFRSGEPVQLPGSADGMMVTLTARHPIGPGPFRLKVSGPRGREVFQREGLEPGPGGVFVLTLSREGFTDGRHRLTLQRGQEPLAEFFLQVTLTQ